MHSGQPSDAVRRAIARCRAEQRRACRGLLVGGPDALGLLMAWADWRIEEDYVRSEDHPAHSRVRRITGYIAE